MTADPDDDLIPYVDLAGYGTALARGRIALRLDYLVSPLQRIDDAQGIVFLMTAAQTRALVQVLSDAILRLSKSGKQ